MQQVSGLVKNIFRQAACIYKSSFEISQLCWLVTQVKEGLGVVQPQTNEVLQKGDH